MIVAALLIVIAIGMLMNRRGTLTGAARKSIGPSVQAVTASVDGRPVHSYVKTDIDIR